MAGKVWFGTKAAMQWIPAPAINVSAGKQGEEGGFATAILAHQTHLGGALLEVLAMLGLQPHSRSLAAAFLRPVRMSNKS